MSVSNDEWIDFLDVRGCDAWFEGDGDVVVVRGGDGDGDGNGDGNGDGGVDDSGIDSGWVSR